MSTVLTPPIIVPIAYLAMVLAYGLFWRLEATSGSWAESVGGRSWTTTGAPK